MVIVHGFQNSMQYLEPREGVINDHNLVVISSSGKFH